MNSPTAWCLLDNVLGSEGLALRERLGNTPDWDSRFALPSISLPSRIGVEQNPSAEIREAFTRIDARAGEVSVSRLAPSRLEPASTSPTASTPRSASGPKSIARIVRFNRALAAARSGGEGWADIAADCGYADQAT